MNTQLSFSSLIQNDLLTVENKLKTTIKSDIPGLSVALDLIFSSGGKRIRPTMILLLGRMINAPEDKLITLATAIEMLHTATLVHDDLIDNSFLRRGNPTLNANWSSGATVLTGDLLFASSARLAANIDNFETMRLFSQTLIEIVNGELEQMFGSRCKVDRDDYYSRIFAKTASMFQTGARSVALINSSPSEVESAFMQYGRDIGIAFQIIDDILDFTGNENTVGKPVASDLRHGLVTLPAIIFIEDHPDHPDIGPLLDGKCLTDEYATDRVINDIRASDSIQKSHQQACRHVDSAVKSLAIFPACAEKTALQELAAYIVQRQI